VSRFPEGINNLAVIRHGEDSWEDREGWAGLSVRGEEQIKKTAHLLMKAMQLYNAKNDQVAIFASETKRAYRSGQIIADEFTKSDDKIVSGKIVFLREMYDNEMFNINKIIEKIGKIVISRQVEYPNLNTAIVIGHVDTAYMLTSRMGRKRGLYDKQFDMNPLQGNGLFLHGDDDNEHGLSYAHINSTKDDVVDFDTWIKETNLESLDADTKLDLGMISYDEYKVLKDQ